MARADAPLTGLTASGTIGGALQFARTAGVSVIKRRLHRRRTATAREIAQRAMFAFLRKEWTAAGGALVDIWDDVGLFKQSSPQTSFTSYNLKRWTDFLGPTENPAFQPSGTLAAVADLAAVAAGDVVTVTGTLQQNLLGDPLRGYLLFRTVTPHPAPSVEVTIAVVYQLGTADPINFRDRVPGPGSYRYKVQQITQYGKKGPTSNNANITVS